MGGLLLALRVIGGDALIGVGQLRIEPHELFFLLGEALALRLNLAFKLRLLLAILVERRLVFDVPPNVVHTLRGCMRRARPAVDPLLSHSLSAGTV